MKKENKPDDKIKKSEKPGDNGTADAGAKDTKDTTPSPPAAPNFNPLSEQVIEKSYTGAGANGMPPQQSDIPEHTYTPPPAEEGDTPVGQAKVKEEEKPKERPPANPDLKFASEKEKHDGAAAMTDIILTTWEQLYKGANQLFKISERTVNKMQASGEIDVRVEVPYKLAVAPLSRVLQDFNSDADKLLVLEKEFKDEVHPLITEELAKAGHGLSNRQKLIYLVSVKLVSDGIKAAQFIAVKKDYLKFAREMTAGGGMTAAPAATTSQNDMVSDLRDAGQQSGEHDEIVDPNTQEPPPRMTMQEEALARLGPPGGVNNSLNLGGRKKLAKLNQEASKSRVRHAPVRKRTPAEQRIADARAGVVSDPTPTGTAKKRKPGRPPGAKNKPKSKYIRR